MSRILLIGTAAGLASALLFASVFSGSLLALGLCFLSPLPIMIVGTGWSNRAGLSAALTAALVCIAVSPALGLAFALTQAAPAWLLAHLVMLGRREGDVITEWYPLGQVVTIAALMAAAIGIIGVFSIATTYKAYVTAMDQGVEDMLRMATDTPTGSPLVIPDIDDATVFVRAFAMVLPLLSSAVWVFSMLFNLWIAGRVVKTSGRLARPWPDLPAMRLPRWIGPLLLASGFAAFLPGMAGLCGRVALAAVITPFAIFGYSALHDLTRGVSGRPAILAAVYAITVVLNWIAIGIVTLFGLLDHFFDLRGRIASHRRPANDNS